MDCVYGDVLEFGVVYKMEFEKIIDICVDGEEYYVRFFFILSIINGDDIRKVWIVSEGIVIYVILCFLENMFGFFFCIYD